MTEEATTEQTTEAPTEENSNSLLAGGTADNSTEAPAEETTDTTTEEVGVYDNLQDDLKNESGEPDHDKIYESYKELRKTMGTKTTPDSVEDYSYEWGDATPEELAEDEVYQSALTKMFDLGLSQDQFSGVMGEFETSMVDIVNSLVTHPEDAKAQLEETWGNNYDENLNHAATAFEAFASQDMDINNNSFNDPIVLELLANIGKQLGEDSRPVATNQAAQGMTETEMRAVMAEDDYYDNPDKQAKVNKWHVDNIK